MKLSVFILFTFLTAIFFSCKKSETTTQPPAVVTAPVSGVVKLFDDGTTALDNSGMSVSVENSSPILTGITASTGKYIIANVFYGSTNIIFEKPGYGTFKIFGIDHKSNAGAGSIIADTTKLGKISGTAITELSTAATVSSVDVILKTNPASGSSSPKYVRLFLHVRNTVSSSVYLEFTDIKMIQGNPATITFSKTELLGMGFTSGATVYVKAYGDSFWSNVYAEPGTSRSVFPNLNLTTVNAASFIVP